MDYYELLKRNRKKPLADMDTIGSDKNFIRLDYGKDAIEKIIAHRDPFLLVDKLLAVNIQDGEETIVGSRFISQDEPVFRGHFPAFPVYPGSLQLEMGGQLGLCLSYFVFNRKTSIDADAKMVNVRATKVLGALFLEPLLPENDVLMISKRLEYDGYFGTVLSQVISEGKVCTVSIAEVIFLEEDE